MSIKDNKRLETELIGVLEVLPDGSIRDIQSHKVYKEYHRGAKGYLSICANGHYWCKHRVIWSLANGAIPEGYVVDHIDGNHLNNSIDNLRLATPSQNQHNRRVNKDKTNGLPKGVCWDTSNNNYKAKIRHNGKRFTKSSKSLEVVVEWLKEKRQELHGEFSCD